MTADRRRGVERSGAALVLLATALLTASCGTRVDRADPAAAASAGPTGAAPAVWSSDGRGSAFDPAAGSSPAAQASSPAEQAGSKPGTVAPSPGRAEVPSRPGATAPMSPSASAPNAPASDKATPGVPPVAGSPGQSGSPGPTPGSPPVGSGKKSPLVVATMCNCSGPPSSSTVPIVQGGQLWVKYINAKGGLNGHPVRQILYDDGNDPARNRAQVQEAIEREHVVAFFVEAAPLSAKSTVAYITSKRIPVVGAALSDFWDYESPMYFPQGPADWASAYGAISGAAQQLLPSGKNKLGIAYCAEAEQCSHIEKGWVQYAGKVGFDLVYEGPISLAQPDFTAVCLSARNAGVQVVAVFADTNTISRFAASCARQGFRPVYTGMPPTVADRFRDDPNMDSYLGGINLFPFFQSGTPATDEFRAAVRTQGAGKVLAGMGSATGWVAGKLLERAGNALTEPPTTEAILKGLWSLQNDDLGGLTQPLQFIEGQTAPKVACWFNIATKGGNWISPDGFQRHCAPGVVN